MADYRHGKGMKFGIHIMRGIHRAAAYKDTPVMGSDFTAKYIAEPWDTCGWCNHMYGVDASKEGAQEYYDSIFKLYASWNVDFIRADDTMFPPSYKGEIEMMHKAIEYCGRPMVLRDNWKSPRHNFELLNPWSSYIQPNDWPDADIIPIGKLSLNNRPHGPERMWQLNCNEQHTLITLWAIARSPLILGGDLLSTPDSIITLFQNESQIHIRAMEISISLFSI